MSEPKKSHTSHIIAGESAILARRYATALFELADEQNVIEPIAADLISMQEAIDAEPHFHVMASHPRLPVEKVEVIVAAIADKVGFHALTKSFLVQLAHHRRLSHLGDMVDAFQADLAKRRGQHVAYITATQKLTAEQETGLSAQLGKIVGGTVRLVIEEDETLLGGLVVKMGSRLIDASVKGKLAQIERQLKTEREAA